MTPQEKILYRIKWHKFQQYHENSFTRVIKKALSAQVNYAINYAEGSTNQGVWVAAIGQIPVDPMYKAIESLYRTVGPNWAAHTGVHRMKALKPMGFSERIVQLMKDYYGIDLFLDAVQITQYTKDVISKVLVMAAEQGWGFDDIVKELRGNSELSDMRARRIARTETVTSANGAAIINAKETGLQMKKTWISIVDKRTRHSHLNVNGDSVDLDAAFNVNGTHMQQPGVRTQPDGTPVPGDEVINCRCTVGFTAVRDRFGKLVRV